MRNFALALALRAVAEMLLPHDRVEGRPKMADAVVTDVTGALDCGVGDIYQMGVSAVKVFWKDADSGELKTTMQVGSEGSDCLMHHYD
jgi:hypothetical protein